MSAHPAPLSGFLPVITLSAQHPLDRLVEPLLGMAGAQTVMLSHYYASRAAKPARPGRRVFVDSGGFAGLLPGARIVALAGGLAGIERPGEGDEAPSRLTPANILDAQIAHGDFAATLDLPIPPELPVEDFAEAVRRHEATVANALAGLALLASHEASTKPRLYASVQAWDGASAREGARELDRHGFAGIAVGGMVPRARDWPSVVAVVEAVLAETRKPVHVFGLGRPSVVGELRAMGVASVDSSAYVRLAAAGKTWAECAQEVTIPPSPSLLERRNLALDNLRRVLEQCEQGARSQSHAEGAASLAGSPAA